MNLSDLQNKEVIDVATGRRIGSIIDVIIGSKGNISKLILEDRKTSRRFLAPAHEEIGITWDQIVKIGDDIILVDGQSKFDS